MGVRLVVAEGGDPRSAADHAVAPRDVLLWPVTGAGWTLGP